MRHFVIRGTMNALALGALVCAAPDSSFAAQAGDSVVVGTSRDDGLLERSSTTGARLRVVSLRQPVSYADLDLTTAAGVAKLQSRVRDVATSLCDQLSHRTPVNSSSTETGACVRAAVADAMAQARIVSTAAEKRARRAGL